MEIQIGLWSDTVIQNVLGTRGRERLSFILFHIEFCGLPSGIVRKKYVLSLLEYALQDVVPNTYVFITYS